MKPGLHAIVNSTALKYIPCQKIGFQFLYKSPANPFGAHVGPCDQFMRSVKVISLAPSRLIVFLTDLL